MRIYFVRHGESQANLLHEIASCVVWNGMGAR
jgi:broad specificity phosphatase PhoE